MPTFCASRKSAGRSARRVQPPDGEGVAELGDGDGLGVGRQRFQLARISPDSE
jgi:hypothetical protein